MKNMKQETITIYGALLGLALIIGTCIAFYFYNIQNMPQ